MPSYPFPAAQKKISPPHLAFRFNGEWHVGTDQPPRIRMACACRGVDCVVLGAADDLALACEQLAMLARRLDLIDCPAEHAANTAPQARAGYHIDYLDKTNGTPFACCWPSQI